MCVHFEARFGGPCAFLGAMVDFSSDDLLEVCELLRWLLPQLDRGKCEGEFPYRYGFGYRGRVGGWRFSDWQVPMAAVGGLRGRIVSLGADLSDSVTLGFGQLNVSHLIGCLPVTVVRDLECYLSGVSEVRVFGEPFSFLEGLA